MKYFSISTKKSFFITFKTIYIIISKNIVFEFIKSYCFISLKTM